MKLSANLILQDSRQPLPLCRDAIDLVVTSPPYFNLLDYQVEGQIGVSGNYEQYLQGLADVWSNLFPHLKQSAAVCINLCSTLELSRQNANKYYNIKADTEQFFVDSGFYLRADIIWDLGTDSFTERLKRYPGTYPSGKGLFVHNFEHILVFQKATAFKARSAQETEGFESSVWHIPWSYPEFPPPLAPEVVSRLIAAFSNAGDLVFDPFAGLGTVALEAIRSQRLFCGVELNPKTHAIALSRIRELVEGW